MMNRPVQIAVGLGLMCIGAVGHASVSLDSIPGKVDTQAVLAELHLIPDILAASGVDADEASVLLSASYDALADRWASFSSQQSQLSDLQLQLASIRQQLNRRDLDSSAHAQLRSDLSDTTAAIASLRQSRAAALAQVAQATTNAMNSEDRTRFFQIRDNSRRSVPVEYRVLDLSEDGWMELRHALAVIKTVEEPPAEYVQTISGYDAEYEVNLARVHSVTHLAGVSAVVSSFLQGLQ